MNFKKLFLFCILLIGIVLFWFWYNISHQYEVKQKEFEITSNTTFIPELIDNVIIGNDFSHTAWKLYLKVFKYDTRLKSGVYTIESDTISRGELIQKLLRGPEKKKTQTLTFIEGWRNEDYSTYLEKQGIRMQDQVRGLTIKDVKARYSFFDDTDTSKGLQGYLFPDTYEVFTDVTEEEVVYRLLDNFNAKITQDMRDEIERTGRNLYEVLTMASIIEKEVRTLETKRTVSGIFYNRLDIGMALQSDATVNYITQSGRDRSTFEDLAIDSPYNTYKYKGLPPGPIANPGFDSIYAAVYPYDTDYFYFLTTPDGRIFYGKTFDQHVRNKNKYLN